MTYSVIVLSFSQEWWKKPTGLVLIKGKVTSKLNIHDYFKKYLKFEYHQLHYWLRYTGWTAQVWFINNKWHSSLKCCIDFVCHYSCFKSFVYIMSMYCNIPKHIKQLLFLMNEMQCIVCVCVCVCSIIIFNYAVLCSWTMGEQFMIIPL